MKGWSTDKGQRLVYGQRIKGDSIGGRVKVGSSVGMKGGYMGRITGWSMIGVEGWANELQSKGDSIGEG